ncbi:hypothetical protein NQZ68_007115 [Dissostichus eleginoides]|nr:hypothetical protein NQZ68_007115 [Dissostichus eleginoides]
MKMKRKKTKAADLKGCQLEVGLWYYTDRVTEKKLESLLTELIHAVKHTELVVTGNIRGPLLRLAKMSLITAATRCPFKVVEQRAHHLPAQKSGG